MIVNQDRVFGRDGCPATLAVARPNPRPCRESLARTDFILGPSARPNRTWVPLVFLCLLISSCARDPNVRKANYLKDGIKDYQSGKYQEAIIEFRNAIQIDSRFAEARYQLGRSYLALKNNNAAYREFHAAVDLNPAHTGAKLELAGLLVASREIQEAQKMAEDVVKADPGSVRGHMILGEIHAITRDFPNAIAEMQKAVDLDPHQVEAYVALGAVYLASNKVPEAEAIYRKAVDANPKSSAARISMAEFSLSQRKLAEAQTELETACDLDPKGVAPRLRLGSVLIAAGHADQAEKLFANLKTLAPDDPQAYKALANYYSGTGQSDKTIAELKSLAASKPKDVSVVAALVDMLLDLQRLNEAEAAIAEPLKKNPENPQLLLPEGRLLIAGRKFTEAITALQKVTRDEPGSARAFYYLGVAQDASGLPDSARESFTKALKLAPQMGQAQAALAGLSAKTHQPDEAVKMADQAIGRNPRLASPYISKARALIDKGDRKQGATLLEEALKHDPASQSALAVLLKLSILEGNTAEVVKRIVELRDKNPQNAGLWFLSALGQFSLKDLDKAEAGVRQAIKLDPNTTDAYSLLGQIHMAKGANDQAKADFRSAIAASPRNTLNYGTLGTIYEKEGNWDEAKKLFQSAHDIDPASPFIADELAYLYLEHGGDVNVALSLAQAAKQKAPNSPVTGDTLGWAYYKIGSNDLATKELKEAAQKAPANAVYQYHLGMAYMTGKNYDLASRSLRAALKVPGFPYAANANSALEKMGQKTK